MAQNASNTAAETIVRPMQHDRILIRANCLQQNAAARGEQGTPEDAKQTTDEAGKKAGDTEQVASNHTGEATQNASDTVKQGTQDVSDKAGDLTQSANETAGDVAQGARDAAKQGVVTYQIQR